MIEQQVLEACKKGIASWQKAFNNQDAKGCAAQYNDNAVMQARPFGTFEGRHMIEAFWQGIIDQGFNKEYCEYLRSRIEIRKKK